MRPPFSEVEDNFTRRRGPFGPLFFEILNPRSYKQDDQGHIDLDEGGEGVNLAI